MIYKNIIGLDFETYYDKEYNLRKMTNTSYVRDERFKTQCVSIKSDKQRRAKNYYGKDIALVLHDIDWKQSALLCHHTHFDGFILSQHYNIIPAFYLCTLSMARPIHGGQIRNDLATLAAYYGIQNKITDVLESTKGIRELPTTLQKRLGVYNNRDVEILWALFKKLRTMYPADELELIHRTVSAFCDPILVIDKDICRDEHKRELRKRQRIVRETGLSLTELRSRTTFPKALIAAGGQPPCIPDEKNKGQVKYTFNKNNLDFQRLFYHPNKTVRMLVKARQIAASTINATRALRILAHGEPTLPIYLNYGKAHTLRWTGGDKMNPQNLPRVSKLRNAIRAPKGHKLVVIDSTSIELHVAAMVAGEQQLLDACQDPNRDPYVNFLPSLYITSLLIKKRTQRTLCGQSKLAFITVSNRSGQASPYTRIWSNGDTCILRRQKHLCAHRTRIQDKIHSNKTGLV